MDTGLHYKGFSGEKALKYFADYAWDTSDGAEKEVTRYQSDPGQATAYMIGQLHIIKVRDYMVWGNMSGALRIPKGKAATLY